MIIKRKLKTRMPSLKRCKLGNSTSEEDERARKKRKVNLGGGGDYYYPLNLLGEIAAGIVPGKLNGKNGLSASWCKEISSSSPVEAESESKSIRIVSDSVRGRDRTADVSRPPLVRTSRGRVQVLPSRFNDSVLENWRKDSKSSSEEGEEEIEECRKEKVKASSNHILKQEAKSNHRYHKYTSALCEERDKCEEIVRYSNSFDMRKHMSSSRTTLASLQEQRFIIEDEARPKKEGVYGPEDFYSGDLVWGKSGRNEPFWPAIVIDPMTQAPELVLRSCIPDAACVMFFGHSGTENERVHIYYLLL